jgi:hypothetical protein
MFRSIRSLIPIVAAVACMSPVAAFADGQRMPQLTPAVETVEQARDAFNFRTARTPKAGLIVWLPLPPPPPDTPFSAPSATVDARATQPDAATAAAGGNEGACITSVAIWPAASAPATTT